MDALSPIIVHTIGDPCRRVYNSIDLVTYVLTIGLPISLTQSPKYHPLVDPTCARAEPIATLQIPFEPLLIAPSPTRVVLFSSITNCHDHIEIEDRKITPTLDFEWIESHLRLSELSYTHPW